MPFANLERTDRRNDKIVVCDSKRATRSRPFLARRRAEALAIHAAVNDSHAPAIDARGCQRIRHATRYRNHAVNRPIEQQRSEHPVGPVVHSPRNDQRTAEAARKRRHRMRARSMEMNHIVAFAFENRAQPDPGWKVDCVADVKRMALYPRSRRPLPKLPCGIANQLRAIAAAGQRERQCQHLRLAAGETQLGIDAHHAQRLGVCCVAVGGHLEGVVILNRLLHLYSFGSINRKICNTGSRTPPSPRRGCRFSCPLHRSVPSTRPALRKFASARAPPSP